MKALEEMTLKDDFLFGVIMSEEENCKTLLEMILGISIKSLNVNKEESLVFHQMGGDSHLMNAPRGCAGIRT